MHTNFNFTIMEKQIKPISAETQKEVARLYTDYKDMVSNHVRRVVKDQHDSEDVTNEVFEKIMRLGLTYNENRGASEATWMHTITNSVIIDFFRTNHKDKYKPVSNFAKDDENNFERNWFIAPKNDNADSGILKSEVNQRIDTAFFELKPEYRRVAAMYFVHQYEYTEISDILDVPMGTVKGMINRSRAMLQEALDGVYKVKASNVQRAEA